MELLTFQNSRDGGSLALKATVEPKDPWSRWRRTLKMLWILLLREKCQTHLPRSSNWKNIQLRLLSTLLRTLVLSYVSAFIQEETNATRSTKIWKLNTTKLLTRKKWTRCWRTSEIKKPLTPCSGVIWNSDLRWREILQSLQRNSWSIKKELIAFILSGKLLCQKLLLTENTSRLELCSHAQLKSWKILNTTSSLQLLIKSRELTREFMLTSSLEQAVRMSSREMNLSLLKLSRDSILSSTLMSSRTLRKLFMMQLRTLTKIHHLERSQPSLLHLFWCKQMPRLS